jgi:hypothetical protein
MAMSDAPKGFLQSRIPTVVVPGGKRKQVSSTSEVEQRVNQSTSKKARRETTQSPVPCEHEKGAEPVTAVPLENADAELSASVPLLPLDESEILDRRPLERLQKDWTAPIYAFFKPTPTIECIDGRRVHVFECIAETCKARGKKARQVNRYLDKADARSTSNLRKHAKVCWGTEVVEAGDRTKNIEAARAVVASIVSRKSSLTSALEGAEKGKLSYILATPSQ